MMNTDKSNDIKRLIEELKQGKLDIYAEKKNSLIENKKYHFLVTG